MHLDRLGGSGRTDRRENKLGWFDVSRTPEDYEVGIDRIPEEGDQSIAWVKSRSDNPRPWGALAYVMDIDRSLGKGVKISASIKGDQVDSGIFWASASGESFERLVYEKAMFYRTFGWKRFEIVLRIPDHARKVQFGLTLDGRRRVLMKDVRLEPIP